MHALAIVQPCPFNAVQSFPRWRATTGSETKANLEVFYYIKLNVRDQVVLVCYLNGIGILMTLGTIYNYHSLITRLTYKFLITKVRDIVHKCNEQLRTRSGSRT